MARKMNPEKPGVMVYFDVMDSMEQLSGEQCKRLIIAIRDYGRDGKEPTLEDDEILRLIWPFVSSTLNRDDERYNKACIRRQYGAYYKAMKRNGFIPLTWEIWEIAGRPTYAETIANSDLMDVSKIVELESASSLRQNPVIS